MAFGRLLDRSLVGRACSHAGPTHMSQRSTEGLQPSISLDDSVLIECDRWIDATEIDDTHNIAGMRGRSRARMQDICAHKSLHICAACGRNVRRMRKMSSMRRAHRVAAAQALPRFCASAATLLPVSSSGLDWCVSTVPVGPVEPVQKVRSHDSRRDYGEHRYSIVAANGTTGIHA